MKKLFLINMMLVAMIGFVRAQQQDPCTQSTKLTDGVRLQKRGNAGTGPLAETPYHYEMWCDRRGAEGVDMYWYGANQGGGAAFRAEWTRPDVFLGRVGYFWGKEDARPYTAYKNIYCDYNYTRSENGTAGGHSYIGIYGWGMNPDAEDPDWRLVEYYIVDDWYSARQLGAGTICGGRCEPVGSLTVDGATYLVYTNLRVEKPSIEGDKTFIQYFSVRQGMEEGRRQCGTISVTEHFKAWEKMGLPLGNLYEAKFLVEAGAGTGWIDLSYLSFSQEDEPRK